MVKAMYMMFSHCYIEQAYMHEPLHMAKYSLLTNSIIKTVSSLLLHWLKYRVILLQLYGQISTQAIFFDSEAFHSFLLCYLHFMGWKPVMCGNVVLVIMHTQSKVYLSNQAINGRSVQWFLACTSKALVQTA